MKWDRIWLFSLLGFLLWGCQKHSEGFLLGVSVPLTGPGSQQGQSIVNGILIATEEVNQEGGILGQPVSLTIRDDQGHPETARQIARALLKEKPAGVVLQAEPETSHAFLSSFAQQKIMLLAPGKSLHPAPKEAPYVFQTLANPDQEAQALIQYLLRSGYRRLALIQENGLYARILAAAMKKQLAWAGLEPQWQNTGSAEPSQAQLQQLLDSGAEAILYAGHYPGAAQWARILSEQGIQLLLATPQEIFDREFIRLAGKSHIQNVITVFPAFQTPGAFAAKYQSRFGELNPLATLAYYSARQFFLSYSSQPTQARIHLQRSHPNPGEPWLHNPGRALPAAYLRIWQPDQSGHFVVVTQVRPPRGKRSGEILGEMGRRASQKRPSTRG